MLYNKNWDHKIGSIDSLIAWLETKPPSRHYCWWDGDGNCLIAQYVREKTGCRRKEWVTYYGYVHFNIRHQVAGEMPYTFGAALKRARAYKGEKHA